MSDKQGRRDAAVPLSMAKIVERNIETLLARRRQEERTRGMQARIAEHITRFTGSLYFVYIHIVLFGSWIVVNLGWTSLPQFDPTFVVLAMFASVEAIFLSTFVLITQNRMQAQADRRVDLDLQISLLADHEITQLLHLVSAIADRVGAETGDTAQLGELKQDVKPEQVLDKIEQAEQRFENGGGD